MELIYGKKCFISSAAMADSTPKRIPFDPQAIATLNLRDFLRVFARLAPLKKTELPIAFFAKGANPFDLLLKPYDKTVLQFLRDIPPHLDAFREVMAFNMLLNNRDLAQQFGLEEIIFLPAVKKPKPVMQNDDPEIWGVEEEFENSVADISDAWLVDEARRADRPMKFLKKIGGMTDELKIETARFFDFDFEGLKFRITQLADALATTERGNVPREKGEIIRDGVKTLVELRDMYRTPTAENKGPLGRLYELIGADIDRIEQDYHPFRQTFGALAFKIRQDIKVSKPDRGKGDLAK